MRPGDRQHPASVQHVVGQPLRAGNVGQAAVEQFFEQRVAARDGVADDVAVGRQRQLLDAVAFDQRDPRRFELRAHRRIDVAVATGDPVPRSASQLGNAAHEGAADAENMNMHLKNPS